MRVHGAHTEVAGPTGAADVRHGVRCPVTLAHVAFTLPVQARGSGRDIGGHVAGDCRLAEHPDIGERSGTQAIAEIARVHATGIVRERGVAGGEAATILGKGDYVAVLGIAHAEFHGLEGIVVELEQGVDLPVGLGIRRLRDVIPGPAGAGTRGRCGISVGHGRRTADAIHLIAQRAALAGLIGRLCGRVAQTRGVAHLAGHQ